MGGVYLLIVTFVIIAIILVTITLVLIRKHRIKSIKEEIEYLDKQKNLIMSTPVMTELSKVEPIIKNEKMGEKYKNWQQRFEVIKNEKIALINDMIIDLDMSINDNDYQTISQKLPKTEIEICKVKECADQLLAEIKEITLSEEKYRSIIIKLKAKYRELFKKFNDYKNDYEDIGDVIELQFENIEKRFLDFEKRMEKNEYDEVTHIVKALDSMIDHMEIVIEETPNLVLLSEKLIPRRIDEIESTFKEMDKEGYSLKYLNVSYNMTESRKNVTNILGRIKVLNLEDCMFELKTMLDYLDSLFSDFERERLAKKLYDEDNESFLKKYEKVFGAVDQIYSQVSDIKNMYDLKESEIENLARIKNSLKELKSEYSLLEKGLKKKEIPYSSLVKEVDLYSSKLTSIEEDLDICLKSFGSMYDDESRAHEQLDEIQELLKQCKIKIRSIKLPIIMDNYFIELSEANEAIAEVIKELQKQPIVIKTLNTRVDTARDLVLKLYNTTNEMVKTAKLVEVAIVYGNRFRYKMKEIDAGLSNAEMLFHKGEYNDALDVTINTIQLVEPDIKERLLKYFEPNE